MRSILHGGDSGKAEEFYFQGALSKEFPSFQYITVCYLSTLSFLSFSGFVVVGVLFLISLLGVTSNLFLLPPCLKDANEGPVAFFVYTVVVVTIVVAPALPVALSIGIAFAVIRLREKNIFCISPPAIILAGRIQVACFDKTGTLTQDAIVLRSWIAPDGTYVPYKDIPNSLFPKEDLPDLGFNDPNEFQKALSSPSSDSSPLSPSPSHSLPFFSSFDFLSDASFQMFLAMSACHSLMNLEVTQTIAGDPLEMEMYHCLSANAISLSSSSASPSLSTSLSPLSLSASSSSAVRVDKNAIQLTSAANNNPLIVCQTHSGRTLEIEIMRRFPFISKLQRMSCLIRVCGKYDFVIMKGSPEMVLQTFCKESAILDQSYAKYTKLGFRVISFAARYLESMDVTSEIISSNSRELAELSKSFSYCGSLVFENPLKPESASTILELSRSHIRSVMITGIFFFFGFYKAITY